MTSLRIAVLTLIAFASSLLYAETVRLGTGVVPVRQGITLVADPRADGYRGTVRIDLDVKKAAKTFRLHAAKEISIGAIALTQGKRTIAVTHAAGADDTLELTAARALQPGRARLTIDFANQYDLPESGLCKVHPKSGEPMLVTDFEPVDARQVFPSFDEPRFKIPWDVSVEIPAQFDAISNAPVASESTSGETKSVHFKPTAPLPSYLVAIAIGQFDYTVLQGTSVPVRIVSPKGQGKLASTAAEMTPPILHALETFFASRYPYEKLDLLAVPEFNHAMENAGAVVFGDRYISLDPASATVAQRSFLAKLLAHELSHMWFGDLVTMSWWDDLWLNESFADWLGDKIAREQFPELAGDVDELNRVQSAMTIDARATTDPTRTRNIAPGQVFSNYATVYLKGKAVLSMFEAWIGTDKFRLGVLDHIGAHTNRNASADDFFASLGKHAPASTAAAFQSFVDLPGIPLVTIEPAGAATIIVRQSRFTTSPNPLPPQAWKIPVSIRYSDGTTTRTASILLDAPAKTVKLEGERIAWLFPQAGATGYYRWNVPAEWLTALASHPNELLTPRERHAFIANLGALLRIGAIHGDAYVDLLGRFANDASPEVLQALLAALGELRLPFETAETQPQLAAFYRETLGPAMLTIGLTPKANEPLAVTAVRPDLLSFLGVFGEDSVVRQFALEQLAKYQKDPGSIDASLVDAILTLSADRGDAALFDDIRKRFESTASPNDRRAFARILGRFHDPEVKKKARIYALTDAVRAGEIFSVTGLPTSEKERDELYQWVTANYAELAKKYNPASLRTLPFIAGGCEPARVEAAKAFFEKNQVEGTMRELERVAEQVNECAALRTRELASIAERRRPAG